MKGFIKNLIVFGFLAGTMLSFYFLVNPKMKQISETRKVLASLNELSDIQSKIVSLQGSLENGYGQVTQKDKADLDILIPKNIDSVRLILEIEKMVSDSGMTMNTIDILDVQDENVASGSDDPQSISFDLEITGNYDQFIQFLSKVENNLRIIDTKEILFVANPFTEEENPDSYDFKVKLETYWLPEKI